MFKKLAITIIIFNGLFLLLSVPTVNACSPVEPDFWYLEIFEVLETNIPEGIIIVGETFEPNSSYQDGLPGLRISNNSSSSIRLLDGQDQRKLLKMGFYQNGNQLPAELEDEGMLMRLGRSERLVIERYEFDNAGRQLRLFSEPVYEDVNIAADDRAGEPPAPQQFNLGLNIGGVLYIIPIQVAYINNPHYDPNRYRNSVRECEEFIATEEAIYEKSDDELPEEGGSQSIINNENAQLEIASKNSGENNKYQLYEITLTSGLIIGLLSAFIWLIWKKVKTGRKKKT